MSLRNLDAMFKPRSVALVGASRRQGSLGAVLARNLLTGGFQGPILPVHPEAQAIGGIMAYPDVASLPLTPDLAVIATGPASVPGLIGEFAARGTRAAIVVTSEFAGDGALRQRMLDAAEPALLRILGPKSRGIVRPSIGLDASLAPRKALEGDLAFVSQSGAMLATALEWATERGIGFSHLVSLGEMADIDFGDMIDYLAADTSAQAILLYVEAITDARKFMSAARAAARVKPVVVVKAGRTGPGAKVAGTHTGALVGEDAVYDAAFRRAGMLRVGTLAELFDAVEMLGKGFMPKGDRLTIVANGGGDAVLATDALIQAGGTLAELDEKTIARLDGVLPKNWSRSNPLDIVGDADGARYVAALKILLEEGGSDAILVLNCPTAAHPSIDVAQEIVGFVEAERNRGKRPPVIATWLGNGSAAAARQTFARARMPSYDVPEAAARGFMQLVDYKRNQAQLMQLATSRAADISPDLMRARAIIDEARADGREWLSEIDAKAILGVYDIPTVVTRAAKTPAEAARVARLLGVPVALKIVSPDIPHKSDVDGVRLHLEGPKEVEHAAHAMLEALAETAPEARITGFSVQEMARLDDGVELLLGAKDDALFGPALIFGAGGTAVEVIDDTAICLVPLTAELARQTMSRTRIWRILQRYRGRPGVDLDALTLTMLKVGRLMTDLDRVAELDINPLLAGPKGVIALDARIRLAEPRLDGVARLAIRPYPRDLERVATLRDGSSVQLRPIRPEDAPALQAMIEASDIEDLRLRFFTALRRLPPQMAARMTQIDYDREMAFVATPTDDSAILGVARLAADPDLERAEYGILVRSDVKGRGLGFRLMQTLITHAADVGIKEIFGEVLAENRNMLEMNRHFGFEVRTHPGEMTLMDVRLPIAAANG